MSDAPDEDKIVDFDRIQGRLAGAPVRRSLIKLVSVFNSVAAVSFVVIGVIVGLVVTDGSFGGFLLGLVIGAIVAVELCGFIAILLDIRDLLAAGQKTDDADGR